VGDSALVESPAGILFKKIREQISMRLSKSRNGAVVPLPPAKEFVLEVEETFKGITVADVLRVCPGARVLTPKEAKALMAVEGLPQ
jgi:hypothetical protein